MTGVDDDDAVARLGGLRVGRQALQEAAYLIGRHVSNGYPATRIHRLLRAAADEPVPESPTRSSPRLRPSNSVDRYLWQIAGIDPHSWGPSES